MIGTMAEMGGGEDISGVGGGMMAVGEEGGGVKVEGLEDGVEDIRMVLDLAGVEGLAVVVAPVTDFINSWVRERIGWRHGVFPAFLTDYVVGGYGEQRMVENAA